MNDDTEKKADLLYQIMHNSIRDKFSILPVMSGLMLALISIGLSGGLFEISVTIKTLLTALLLLMIFSIQIYFSETISNLHEAGDRFYKLFGEKNPNHAFTLIQSIKYLATGKIDDVLSESNFCARFSSQFSSLAILIMWFIVFVMIIEIWT